MAQSIRGFSNRQQTVRRGIAPGVRRKGSANSPGGCRDASSPDQSRSSRQRPDSDKSLSYTPSSNQCGPRQSDPKARYRLLGIASHNGPWEGHTDHSLQASSSRNRACGAPAVALICCGGPAQWFVSQTGKGEEVLPPGSGCLSSHLTLEVSGPVQPICFSSDFLALPAGLLLHLSPQSLQASWADSTIKPSLPPALVCPPTRALFTAILNPTAAVHADRDSSSSIPCCDPQSLPTPPMAAGLIAASGRLDLSNREQRTKPSRPSLDRDAQCLCRHHPRKPASWQRRAKG